MDVPRVIEALVAEVRERYGGEEEEESVDKDLLAKVRSQRGEWRVEPTPALPRSHG